MVTTDDLAALAQLDLRLETLLPEEYQGAVDSVQPTPMGSAALRFDADGRVAWDEIWDSFCDLAMAGGPPHKGRLLEPGAPTEISAAPEQYAAVVQEVCRGVQMVADLEGSTAPDAGWIRIRTFNDTMAAWLLRAITMENVAVRATGNALDLPAAPSFRLEKEIKNVITVIAKTCHYWVGHLPREQQRAIGRLFDTMAAESPLIVPTVMARTSQTCAPRWRERCLERPGSIGWSFVYRLVRRRTAGRPSGDLDDAGDGGAQRPGPT